MANAKIEFKLGTLTFTGEGEESWVSAQLDKILASVPKLVTVVPLVEPQDGKVSGVAKTTTNAGTLASYLASKGATTNQVRRFLATASWLKLKGREKIATKDVANALKDNHQSRLGNPADCLNQNVGKGFCEKDGDLFFVTDEGIKSLGN
jgi:hypothetical protein